MCNALQKDLQQRIVHNVHKQEVITNTHTSTLQ